MPIFIIGEKFMLIPQKTQYGLRAIFELAKRKGQGPVKIADIAQSQAIPQRFLEVILSQLKRGGFVESVRGNEGGYYLIKKPSELTIGEVIIFMQGPIGPVDCLTGNASEKCPLTGDCVFYPLWEKVRNSIAEIYDNTTFQNLIDEEKKMKEKYVPSYAI